jgi:outer membrane protein OmpA-like peptidoglycan-associated protein
MELSCVLLGRSPMVAVIFLCLLLIAPLKGQHKRDSLRLYYGINEVSSPVNTRRLDSLCVLLKKQVVAFRIYGYADFIDSDDYNLGLSQRRAEAVRDHLRARLNSPHLSFIACEGRGERGSGDNGSPGGDAASRRVDLYWEISGPRKEVNTLPRKVPMRPDTARQRKKIEELDPGETLNIEGLGFEPGRHVILKSSRPALQKLLQTLKDNPDIKIEIHGHVCCTPGGMDGMDVDTGERLLSVNRARAVYQYLVNNGISPKRLSYAGYGHSRPLVDPETTTEEEQRNRRVEIMITEK